MGKGHETRIVAILRHTIVLATRRAEEYDANLKGPYPLRNSADVVREAMESIRFRSDPDAWKAQRPHDYALWHWLQGLDPEDLRRVYIVWCAGCADDDILAASRLRQDEGHAEIARRLADKTCLAEDLEKGLAIAKRDGVDLDTDI
ncbi:hypothetical protein [Polyangium sp. 15x6]|uniref:hypothetical protein n=1 Tax=Polyangium sp. 15x6 TaxID=3042687 RepID=UPI00249CA5D1|nr:hypothetical protein [Polyangium sp. 15x6]MDI3282087.1 hypothetical protein [Polyangium sp. 15x6]